MKKGILVTLAFILLTVSLVFAGGGAQNTGSGSGQSTGDSVTTTVPPKPINWKESDATKSLSFHVLGAMSTLDGWAGVGNDTSRIMGYLLYDPLVTRDEEGNFIPWVAESWKMASDSMSITFNLRQDVYFTNGERMTADDVIFTFERIKNDTVNLSDATTRNWRPFIDRLAKNGDFEVTLYFSQIMSEFWSLIIHPSVGILNKRAYEQMGYQAFWRNPVATGAYVVQQWDPANSIGRFTIRTDQHGYWAYRATGTYTNVKDITIAYSPEGQTRIASLRSGEVHVIESVPAADREILDRAGFITRAMRPVNFTYLQVNSRPGAAFEDRRLREALSLCIDRDLIVDSLLFGYGVPATEPSRPGDLGHTGRQTIFYNSERARQLVRESNYDGRPLNFIFTTSVVNIGVELTQAIQSMAADVGINLRIQMLEVAMQNRNPKITKNFGKPHCRMLV